MARKKTKAKAKKPTQKAELASLNRWNAIFGIVFLQEIILLLILSRDYSLPVTTNYLAVDSLASQTADKTVWAPASHHLFDINLIFLVAAILAVGALTHLLAASLYRKRYEADLKQGVNKLRWLTHIVGGGLVLITLALMNGVYDFSTLLAIFALVEVAGLFGLLVEARPEIKRHPRAATKLAFVAFITPWLIISFYLFGAQIFGDRSLPAHVYWLDISIFVLFVLKLLNNHLHKIKYNRWADYLFMEKTYLVLSFLVKSAIAWQIFFAVLNP